MKLSEEIEFWLLTLGISSTVLLTFWMMIQYLWG